MQSILRTIENGVFREETNDEQRSGQREHETFQRARDVPGKVQEQAGKLTGDKEKEKAKGPEKQVTRKHVKEAGEAKEAANDAIHDL
jgi:uncharacterized protein YjbJ (UPF0337 family)